MKTTTQTLFTTVLFLLGSMLLQAQAPFSTLVKEPRFVKKQTTDDNKTVYKAVDSATVSKYLTQSETEKSDTDTIVNTQKDEIDFFGKNSLSFSILSKGENRASISAQVIHYKLYVADPSDANTYATHRYNIPLLLISKLSSSYDTINSSSAIDVLDYEAAPVTLRVMPSFKVKFDNYKDEFLFGMYADMRGLNIYNQQSTDYDVEVIGSGGIGFTYRGSGEAGTYNEKGEDYSTGKYQISVMLQGAIGKKEVIGRLFNTDENYTTSIQSYFLFNVAKNSKMNLKIGYQYFFDRTLAGDRSNFSIALGI
ncbi:hypothetical protein [Aquimarina brevivitae]|uniref:Uncharacterized protein n=1 Tax=Aquimarina brevivitae TaxID=323412 RepID=A0A4Q7P3B8_9FLAO|nr:hypothetical protein [Aquimarina brevivitae]RZS93868.1 hypothetical protein EV197_2449 [Aquimarina brevivitae]